MLIFILTATIWMGLAFAYIFLNIILHGQYVAYEPNRAIIMAEFLLAITYAGMAIGYLIRTVVLKVKHG